jgi:hypothetical protein
LEPTLNRARVAGRRGDVGVSFGGASVRYSGHVDGLSGEPRLDRRENGEVSSAEWEHDLHLLRSTAYLSDTRPRDLLRKVSWSVGKTLDVESFGSGRPLSAATRNRLKSLLGERLRLEEETIEKCRETSAQIVLLVPSALVLLVAMLLLR